MTFTDIVTMVQGRLNLSSTESATRIGSVVNSRYQELLADLGLQVHTRVVGVASGAGSIGSPVFSFSGIEKLERVYYMNGSQPIFLAERPFDELRELASTDSGDTPTRFAVQAMVASAVTVRVDKNAATTYTLYADGLDTTDVLSGSQVPAIPTNFHYILVEAALADELLKMEKETLAGIAEGRASRGISKLKLFIAKSTGTKLTQQQK